MRTGTGACPRWRPLRPQRQSGVPRRARAPCSVRPPDVRDRASLRARPTGATLLCGARRTVASRKGRPAFARLGDGRAGHGARTHAPPVRPPRYFLGAAASRVLAPGTRRRWTPEATSPCTTTLGSSRGTPSQAPLVVQKSVKQGERVVLVGPPDRRAARVLSPSQATPVGPPGRQVLPRPALPRRRSIVSGR